MSKDKNAIIEVQGATIIALPRDNMGYISLGNMLRAVQNFSAIATRQFRSLTSHFALRACGTISNAADE